MSAENKFDINAHLSQIGFGSKSDGGGGGSGEAMTPDKVIPKGIDKSIQTFVGKILGLEINTDIEGKSAFSQLETQNVGSGFSLSGLSLFKDLPGGHWLQAILKYLDRNIISLFNGSEGGSASGEGGNYGGGGEGGGATGDYSGAHAAHSGGGDFHGHSSHGHGEMPDVKVEYGGKMVSAEAMVADLGNLRPSATPTGGRDSDMGMAV